MKRFKNVWREMLVGVIVLSALVFLYVAMFVGKPQPPKLESFAPQYDLVLQDYSGNDVRLASFARKILVVHAWATWCTYCADELQNLATLKDHYGEDIQILAVNRAEAVQVAKPFSDQLNLQEKIVFLIDTNDAFYKAIGGYAMPETLFVNQQGVVLLHRRGPMTIAEVEAEIDALVK